LGLGHCDGWLGWADQVIPQLWITSTTLNNLAMKKLRVIISKGIAGMLANGKLHLDAPKIKQPLDFEKHNHP